MAIEKGTLTPGTILAARFKKVEHRCTVETNEDGSLAYVLADGSRFTSPSAAGAAVMAGVSCNGLRFWSREAELKPARTPKSPAATAGASEPKATGKAGRRAKLFTVLKSQTGVPEGQTRWFGSCCMNSFDLPTGETPTTCPAGHTETPAA